MFFYSLRKVFGKLNRARFYNIINIAGLSIGLFVFTVILLFVNREKSYDKWNDTLKHTFRVGVSEQNDEGISNSQSVQYPLGTYLTDHYPEIEKLTRVMSTLGDVIISRENADPFFFKKMISADSSFFQVFPYVFIRGNAHALDKPNTAVMTRKVAENIFGNEDPLGKTFQVNLRETYMVTGIIEKSGPSHLDFDICLSYHSLHFADNWFMKNFDTYITIRKDANPVLLAKKASTAYAENYARSYFQFGNDQLPENETDMVGWLADKYKVKDPVVFLEAVGDIHLNPKGYADYAGEVPVYDFSKSNQTPITIFTIIASLVLLLACINYINMSVAQNIKKIKDTGIRKVLGASKRQLILQNIVEAFGVSLIALLVCLSALWLLNGWINGQFNQNLTLWNQFNLKQNLTLIFQLGIILAVTSIATGLYPAYILSHQQPTVILKGGFHSPHRSKWVQNSLLVMQFLIASGFIVCVIIIFSQMNYMRKSDPGFHVDQVLRIQPLKTFLFPGQPGDQSEYVETSLLNIPGVREVSSGSLFPGMTYKGTQKATSADGRTIDAQFSLVNYNYFDVLGIPIESGRSFSKNYRKDSSAGAVINEAMVRQFGWKNALGKIIDIVGKNYQVIGVTKDARMAGFDKPVAPQIFMMSVDEPRNFAGHDQVFIKIGGGHIPETLKSVLAFWKQMEPEFPVRYSWLDQDFDNLFARYQLFSTIIFYLTIVSIVIASMGVIAISNFTAKSRIKEIGIRKMLGASAGEIVKLLSGRFVSLSLIAFVIALPAAWLLADKWLQHFAYRIKVTWWMFVLAGIAILIITFIAAGFHALKAARGNPVEALRSE